MRRKQDGLDRRGFFSAVAAGGAATLAGSPGVAQVQASAPSPMPSAVMPPVAVAMPIRFSWSTMKSEPLRSTITGEPAGGTLSALASCARPMAGTPARSAWTACAPSCGRMADGCFQCHGTVGQRGVGPRLAPNPIPAAAIAPYIRNPANVMTPYVEKVLGDAEVQDIHAYLATITPPPSRRDIPLLAP